jgi:hypothetical protein
MLFPDMGRAVAIMALMLAERRNYLRRNLRSRFALGTGLKLKQRTDPLMS